MGILKIINVYIVFGGINMKEKEITINVMIKLLELAKNHPLFCVSYYIVDKNNEIETWIRKRVNRRMQTALLPFG